MDRVDFFHLQAVKEDELDLAFDLVEQAQQNRMVDVGMTGIASGAVPFERAAPNITFQLEGPLRAYDKLGRRVVSDVDPIIVNCNTDLNGLDTKVTTAGYERWLSVFVRHKLVLSEPKTDGLSQTVYWRVTEDYEVVVRQAPEAPLGTATRVALRADELLVCDVYFIRLQTQILNADLFTDRREALLFVNATAIGIDPLAWLQMDAGAVNVQQAFDNLDSLWGEHVAGTELRHPATAIDTNDAPWDAMAGAGTDVAAVFQTLDNLLTDHFNGDGLEHDAAHINATPTAPYVGNTVAALLNDIVTRLANSADPAKGSALIGFDPSGIANNNPIILAAGTLAAALTQLTNGVNNFIDFDFGATHNIVTGQHEFPRANGMTKLWETTDVDPNRPNLAAWAFTSVSGEAEWWLTLNTTWDSGASEWNHEMFGPALALRLGITTGATQPAFFDVFYQSHPEAAGWARTTWERSMSLAMDNTELGDWTGDAKLEGIVDLYWYNRTGATILTGVGNRPMQQAVHFTTQRETVPSSITLIETNSVRCSFPTVSNPSTRGFVAQAFNDENVNVAEEYSWFGSFVAE